MRFIPIDKIKKLREASAQGDERAKKILQAQLSGSDFGADLEAYFSPKQESHSMPAVNPGPMPEHVSTGNAKLDEWLQSNGIKDSDEDYEEALEEYFMEFPEERPEELPLPKKEEAPVADVEEEIDLTKEMAQGIIELISKCDQTLLQIMQNEELDDTSKKGAMTSLQEIKQSLFDAAEKVKKIKVSLDKKAEAEAM